MDHYIDEKDKELGRARLSQGGEGASAGGGLKPARVSGLDISNLAGCRSHTLV